MFPPRYQFPPALGFQPASGFRLRFRPVLGSRLEFQRTSGLRLAPPLAIKACPEWESCLTLPFPLDLGFRIEMMVEPLWLLPSPLPPVLSLEFCKSSSAFSELVHKNLLDRVELVCRWATLDEVSSRMGTGAWCIFFGEGSISLFVPRVD